jgi:hypothetical protein
MVTKKNDKQVIGEVYLNASSTPAKTVPYTPEELKTAFEAISIAPGFLSKRFILTNLLGWSDDMIKSNMQLRMEEEQQAKIGDRLGGYK